MEARQAVRDLLDKLPNDCSLDDLLYHPDVIQRVSSGLEDVENRRTISHEQVEEELRRRWLLGAGQADEGATV